MGQKVGMGVGFGAITGITYLSYMGHQMRAKATPEQQLSLFHPVVQERLGTTMAYFSGACAGTGFLMGAFRNNAAIVNMNPWLVLGLSLATLVGTHMISYEQNFALKNLMFAGFIGTMGVSLVPMMHMY